MKKTRRNELCPCGSGKKFKHCHLGKEDEIILTGMSEISTEMSARITGLPQVNYGRSREMVEALDVEEVTGSPMGIRFIDLKRYHEICEPGRYASLNGERGTGGVVVNVLKTRKTDPENIYVAISPHIGDSTLVHELAHVLGYLKGSQSMPGIAKPLSFDIGIPVEHLEHPHEFGYWLDYFKKEFDVQLDADDTIILYLYRNGMLVKAEDIKKQDRLILKSKSDRILQFLAERSAEIDGYICGLPGYIGSRATHE